MHSTSCYVQFSAKKTLFNSVFLGLLHDSLAAGEETTATGLCRASVANIPLILI
jgi:hypothetical protein